MTKEKKETIDAEEIEDEVVSVGKKVKEAVEKVAESVEEAIKEDLSIEDDDKKAKKKKTKDEEDKDDKKGKIEALKKKLKEKAKALEGKIDESDKVSIKEKVTGEKEEKKDMLVPIEDYLKSSIHLGTRVITPDMRKYVYRRRADGLAVFNTSLLDDKMREAIDYISQFSPEQFIVVCKREAGWKAASLFAQTIGVRAFTKKYPSGVLTNTKLENFFETDMVLIGDPWLDKNALTDSNRVGMKVMSLCDTNNFTNGIDFVIPGNNKSWKSIGMIFYLLTRGYVEKRKLDVTVPPIQDFVEDWDELQPPV